MKKTITNYAFRTRLDLPYAQAVEKVKEALKDEGFGVLTEIDSKATFKQKLEIDFRNYVILGACDPHLAQKALTKDFEIGLLLPCNVIVYEDGEKIEVAIVDPKTMLTIMENPELDNIAEDARERLQRVIQSLA